jgi:hypothetical protein
VAAAVIPFTLAAAIPAGIVVTGLLLLPLESVLLARGIGEEMYDHINISYDDIENSF